MIKEKGGKMLQRIELWYDKIGRKMIFGFVALLLVYIFLKYLFGISAPFIIGWGLATLLNPFVTWLTKTIKMPRLFGTILSMIIIIGFLSAVVGLLIKQLWYQGVSFAQNFPYYKEQITAMIPVMDGKLDAIREILPIPNTLPNLNSIIEQVLNSVGEFLKAILPWTYDIVSKVPNAIIFIIVTLISAFFMTKDYNDIKSFVKAQIPERFKKNIGILQSGLWGALGGYVRTQLIMMSLTFAICLVGLFIIKVPYLLLISVCIAVFDALPVFGSGAILIPWAIYHVLMGHYGVAIGLIGIYISIFLTRQLIEPRILSGQIGVYALVTVMSMYVGFRLMGVIGLIVGPVTMVIIKTLQNTGVLPAFKKVPKE